MEPDENRPIDAEAMRTLKHDIKNQLSGMILCIEQLRFELGEAPEDQQYYMRSISEGCANINKLLNSVE